MNKKSYVGFSLAGLLLMTQIIPLGSLAMAEEPVTQPNTPTKLRFATYNVSLYGKAAGQIRQRLIDGKDRQAERIASIVQTVRPDILLLNEIDYDTDGGTAKLLAEKFFGVGQGDLSPIEYPFVYAAPSNTGLGSGMDLDGNSTVDGPADAFGFGVYPGQYAMAVFSRYPIDEANIRTFQKFLWKDLPAALRPKHPVTGKSYYEDAVWDRLRLSSKNHIDVPVKFGSQTVHILASHPTPPVFDGPEDHNGCRNHDEIRFWADYIGNPDAGYLVDDQGISGGIAPDAAFFIAGDLNSDPTMGDSRREAIAALLGHPRVTDPKPTSEGAVEAAIRAVDQPSTPKTAPVHTAELSKFHTAEFGRGNHIRVDYALPSSNWTVSDSGVFWPTFREADYSLILASDHRMVWVEVVLPTAVSN